MFGFLFSYGLQRAYIQIFPQVLSSAGPITDQSVLFPLPTNLLIQHRILQNHS